MRFRDLFILSVIGLSTWFVAQQPIAGIAYFATVAPEVNRIDADRNNAIDLDQHDWVVFQIPDASTAVRLLTNAAVKTSEMPVVTQADPRTGWRYAIEYQLMDSSGNLIDESEYHFRSRVEAMIDVATGKPVYPMFFEDSTVATETRVMQIGLRSLSDMKPSLIRIRFRSADSNIESVVARVLSQVERKDANKRTTWNRLSRQRRDAICKYCVYDSDLLGFDERANLLRWHWILSPTIGDFKSKPVYSLNDLSNEAVAQQTLPAGRFAAADWISSIAIPSAIGDVRLEFISPNDDLFKDFSAQIDWFGNHPRERSSSTIDAPSHTLHEIEGGLIQIKTNQECVIRAFWIPRSKTANQSVSAWFTENHVNENGEYEITPELAKTRAYLIDESQIEYQVSHRANQSTPFRVSVRQIFDNQFFTLASANEEQDPLLDWEFLDQSGNLADSGTILVKDEITQFDHLKVSTRQILLSDAKSIYFAIPPGIKSIRFRSRYKPLLINCSVRPAGIVRVTRVPEDYSPFDRRERTTRSWFSLNPVEFESLFQDNRSFIVYSQPVAPEIDPLILLGQYKWNRYIPKGDWIGREILVPMKHEPDRSEVIQSVYNQVDRNRDYSISRYEVESQPKILKIFVAGERSPGLVVIEIGGEAVYSRDHASVRGTIELPMPLFSSTNSRLNLRVSSEHPCRFFIGGLKVHNSPQYLKRTAQRFGRGKLQFDYEKKTTEQELLTLQMYRGASADERCQIRVRIEPDQSITRSKLPVESWTILDRIYDLRAAKELNSFLLDTDKNVDAGFRCFINLDTDLPIGNYRIQVECMEKDSDAYALLFQTEPGMAPRRQINSVPQTFRAPRLWASTYSTELTEKTISRNLAGQPAIDSDSNRNQRKKLEQVLSDLLRIEDRTAATMPSDEMQIEKVQKLFRQTAFAPAITSDLVQRWERLGWELIELPNHKIVVVREMPGRLHGRGMYAIRRDSHSEYIVQAPHRFFDERTGIITRKLFAENEILAAAWNSSHRNRIDLAHEQRHYFNAFMTALADESTKVIQLHGFESQNRNENLQTTEVILSDSTRFPARHALQTAVRLKELLGREKVRLFPVEVNQLGGTKNSQAARLRNMGLYKFLHVEMDSDYRLQLANSASKRQEFAAALLDSGSNPNKQPRP